MTKPLIGGQAVIEGVLMRAPNHYSVAVRQPNNKISVKTEKHVSYTKRNKFFGLPFVRGIVVLVETVVIGSRALTYSANEALEDEEELSNKELGLTLIISIVVALLIFKFLPLLLASFFKNKLGLNNFMFNIVDGVIKFSIFIGYLWVISLMDDVQRMFEYHGAEHMAVHCYEAKKKLTVKNARKYKTVHPRCGTEFLLLVLVVSILFYMFIPIGTTFLEKFIIRIFLLPVIAGVSYELLKVSGSHYDLLFFKIMAAPGLLLQKITTKKPSDDQIEVAIKSLEAALEAELKASSSTHS
ncbi:MAG: DUF1385 domain-containing protein [Nanoarchaeota archaeon]|nr:DUF1385 domain-containing protein [Nanoarchaeota archaeon]MBU1854427.1 DUF1385 domain-containing protein [Nanoarchaeota archaeon]